MMDKNNSNHKRPRAKTGNSIAQAVLASSECKSTVDKHHLESFLSDSSVHGYHEPASVTANPRQPEPVPLSFLQEFQIWWTLISQWALLFHLALCIRLSHTFNRLLLTLGYGCMALDPSTLAPLEPRSAPDPGPVKRLCLCAMVITGRIFIGLSLARIAMAMIWALARLCKYAWLLLERLGLCVSKMKDSMTRVSWPRLLRTTKGLMGYAVGFTLLFMIIFSQLFLSPLPAGSTNHWQPGLHWQYYGAKPITFPARPADSLYAVGVLLIPVSSPAGPGPKTVAASNRTNVARVSSYTQRCQLATSGNWNDSMVFRRAEIVQKRCGTSG